jgi:predicted RecA/RadA family phage recombinase
LVVLELWDEAMTLSVDQLTKARDDLIQPGSNLTLPAPAAVSTGDGVLVGPIFGIASVDAALNADVVIATQGVFTMPKVSTDAFAIGMRRLAQSMIATR